jgi:aminocarboxymuconate-semialdehyde decarboxylase
MAGAFAGDGRPGIVSKSASIPTGTADRDLARQLIRIRTKNWPSSAQQPDRFVALPRLRCSILTGGRAAGRRHQTQGSAASPLEERQWRAGRSEVSPLQAKAENLASWYSSIPRAFQISRNGSGNGLLTNVISNPLKPPLPSHLIFRALDRFPGLKLCAAQRVPSYSARSDHGCLTFPDRCSGMPLKKRPSEYMRDLYFDSIVFTPEALRHLVAECGASQIVMGTDYPYPWTSTAVEHILGTPSLSDAERAAILGDNACKLLRIPS